MTVSVAMSATGSDTTDDSGADVTVSRTMSATGPDSTAESEAATGSGTIGDFEVGATTSQSLPISWTDAVSL